MTIDIGSTKAAALAAADESNNPIIAWDNEADGATLSTTTGTQLASAAFAATGTTYDAWGATPDTNVADLQIVLGSSTAITFAAIAAHNLADVGATIKPQYSTNSGGVWNDTESGAITPTDNQALAWYFDSQTADYWRFHITGASGDVYIATAFVGNVITMPQRIYRGYDAPLTPNIVDLQSNVSEGGNLLGSAATRMASTVGASFTDIPATFFRAASWLTFQSHYNHGNGFFWAWRPTKYGDCHYAWRSGDAMAPVNSGPKDRMSVDLSMRLYDDP
jgi:hypothetical protein